MTWLDNFDNSDNNPSPYDFNKWVLETGRYEGFEPKVYKDSRDILTIGYGFNLEDPAIRNKLKSKGFDVNALINGKAEISEAQAFPLLEEIYKESFDTARKKFSNFDQFPDQVKHTVTDMVYNMGETRFDGFKKMKAALQNNDFKEAGVQIESSKYYTQTGNRAKANVGYMWEAGKAYDVAKKYKTATVQDLVNYELEGLGQSTYAPVSTDVSSPPMKKNGGLTLPYWKDLDKQYYINSDRTPREYKSGGWTDLNRRYGYYGQYPGYAYGSHVVHGGPTWPEYAMGLDSGATLHQTLDTLRGNPTPKILDTSAQGNMPKKAKYPSYYSQGVKKYSLPEEGRSLYGDGDTVDLKLPSTKKAVKSGMNLEGYLAQYPIPTSEFNVIGGINPMYYGNRFSVGPYATGHAGTEGTGLNDYGIRSTYNLGKNLLVGTDLNLQGIRAGVQYKFEKGGSLTDEYRRVRSTIPRVSFDAPSNMYTGPTTQRGITFKDGGPTTEVLKVDPQTGLPMKTLPEIEITTERPDTYNNYITNKYKDAGLGSVLFGMPLDYVFGYPQAAATKLMTGKYQLPSEAMGIENPVGAFATDAVLDPANLIGAGVLTKDAALAKLAASKESGLLSNTWRSNPFAEKLANPNKSYRVAGMDAARDFQTIGVLRSNPPIVQANLSEGILGTRTTPFPSFQKGYADLRYLPEEGGVIFETDLPTFKRGEINPVTGNKIRGSHYAHRAIDPTTGKVLTEIPSEHVRMFGDKPHWLRGYKEVPKKETGGMIKRADGSYSRRGLWDNIRANKGSGKKPTKEMLKQEAKIRAAEKKADGSFVGIEPMTNLNIPEPRYNKTPDKAVMPVVYANEPNTPDWSKGAKFADGGYTNKNKNNWLDNL